MRDKLEILKELQGLDLQLNEKRQGRKQLADEQAKIAAELGRVQEMVDALQGQVEQLEAQRRDLTHDLQIEEENIGKAENRLPTIKTQREYVAVLKEVDTAKKLNKEIQEKIASLDTEMAGLNAECQEKEAELAKMQEEVQERQKEIETALAECDTVLGEGDGRRDGYLDQLPAPLRKRYEMLLDRRAGVAVVEARQETCCGCNMNLPPQLFNSLYTTDEILACPHCNRMLYLETTEA